MTDREWLNKNKKIRTWLWRIIILLVVLNWILYFAGVTNSDINSIFFLLGLPMAIYVVILDGQINKDEKNLEEQKYEKEID